MIIRIFAAREPAKPLNDAQMCGSFFVYTYFPAPRYFSNFFTHFLCTFKIKAYLCR